VRNFLKRVYRKLRKARIDGGDRVQNALCARRNAVNDFFGGWEEKDLELLRRYKSDGSVVPEQGEIVDWLGIRTAAALHAWLKMPPSGTLKIQSLPVPDDQVHAETIEYVALLVGLERALQAGDKTFTVVELGASYAPWATAAGVLARRAGCFEAINLVAVEASKNSIPTIVDHAARNGLRENVGVKMQAIHGAIYISDENVFFPKVNVAGDNGAQIALAPVAQDYRGLKLEYETVKGVSLATLCAGYDRIDFLHMDVQGAEAGLLNDESFLSTLDARVATFFLATQSRLIEGIALQKLSALGWVLVRERPTTYRQNDRTKDINGWTLRDGGQLWLNRKFGEHQVV
jgi:FkbM family methyltransferase